MVTKLDNVILLKPKGALVKFNIESKNKIVLLSFSFVTLFAITAWLILENKSEEHKHDSNTELATKANNRLPDSKTPNIDSPIKELTSDDKSKLKIGDEIVEVIFVTKQLVGLDYELLPDSGLEFYEELSERASDGDILAARVLAQQLDICSQAAKDGSSLDKQIEVVNQALRFEAPKEFHDIYGSYEDGQAYISQLKSDYSFCKSISQEKIDGRFGFYEIASDGGDFLSSNELQGIYARAEDWQKVHDVSWDLWTEHGSAQSLSALSLIYEDDLIVPKVQLSSEYSNDVLAHAFNIISSEVDYYSLTQRYPNQQLVFRSEYDDGLARTSSVLSPAEQGEAERYASRLIAENKNCCLQF